MRIVCVGDSITFGEWAEQHCWVRVLGGRYPEHEFVNAGVCYDTSRLGLERFPRDVQRREPSAVVIQFGHNDANAWESDRGHPRVSLHAFEANLQEMIERSRMFGAQQIVLCQPHFTTRHDATYGLRLGIYREGIARLRGVDVDVVSAPWAEPDDLMVDGIHPNAKGHVLYADVIEEALFS